MFQTKICGVTNLDDARAAVEAGVDILGLNFFAASPRYVAPEIAQAIAATTPLAAGVFVNSTADEINRIAECVGLDWIQLHGDEPAELLADIREDLPIIRVRCLGTLGVPAILEDLEACRKVGREPAALLIDARVPGQYGGTGHTVDWSALAEYRTWLGTLPLILAGGLQADNVAEAIALVRPTAVDTASGVESKPGVKDPAKMRSFVQAANSAFKRL